MVERHVQVKFLGNTDCRENIVHAVHMRLERNLLGKHRAPRLIVEIDIRIALIALL